MRAHIETERARRAATPLHEREREDAPPDVMRNLWRQLRAAAVTLGLAPPLAPGETDPPYDPKIYAAVYLAVLAGRHRTRLPLDAVLPAGGLSPYDLRVPSADLVPEPQDIPRPSARRPRSRPARYPSAIAWIAGTGRRTPDHPDRLPAGTRARASASSASGIAPRRGRLGDLDGERAAAQRVAVELPDGLVGRLARGHLDEAGPREWPVSRSVTTATLSTPGS